MKIRHGCFLLIIFLLLQIVEIVFLFGIFKDTTMSISTKIIYAILATLMLEALPVAFFVR